MRSGTRRIGRSRQDGLAYVRCMCRAASGHNAGDGGHIATKGDNESSITSVHNAIAQRLGGKVTLENYERGEHDQWSYSRSWKDDEGICKSGEEPAGEAHRHVAAISGRDHAAKGKVAGVTLRPTPGRQ